MMYDKVSGYKKGMWEKYASHTDKEIKGFFGPLRFLSNFHISDVYYEGLKYLSSENAYQAAKLIAPARKSFCEITPYQSKTTIRAIFSNTPSLLLYSSENWDLKKYDIMASVVFDKFLRNIELRKMLINTGEKYLEETNWWGDVYWGMCNSIGENNLGKILMRVRDFWKQ